MIDFDFHIHSIYSSCASQTVKQAVEQAYHAGIDAVSLCDHNCITGLNEARQECDRLGMTFINGVEISAGIGNELPSLTGYICHVLGYAFDNCGAFNKRMESIKQQYIKRLQSIADFLYEKQYLKSQITVTTSKELRNILVRDGSFISDEAAKSFLNSDEIRKKFPEQKIRLSEVVHLIHDMGGLAVLAHPCVCENHKRINTEQATALIDYLVSLGLDGVELFHEDVLCDIEMFNTIRERVDRYHLLVTLGSDRHHINEGTYFKMQPMLDTIEYNYKSIKHFWRNK